MKRPSGEGMVVRCPFCNMRIMDIKSGSKPFKPSAGNVGITTKCSRCKKTVEIKLYNEKKRII